MEISTSCYVSRSVPSHTPSISATAHLGFINFPSNAVSSRTRRFRSGSEINKSSTVCACMDMSRGNELSYRESVGDAVDLFRRKLHGSPIPPVAVEEFGNILQLIAGKRQYPIVISLYKEMGASQISPNTFILNTVIECYCRLRNPNNALELLREMQEVESTKPNVVTYTTLIAGLCRLGKTNVALELLREMQEGESVKPDVITYNTVIRGFCKKGKLRFASELLMEMVDEGWKPNIVTYNAFLGGLCKKRKTTAAVELLRVMAEEGTCKPDVLAYNVVIKKLCKSKDIITAVELVTKMVEDGCKPDTVTYTAFIDLFHETGHSVAADELLKELEALRENHKIN